MTKTATLLLFKKKIYIEERRKVPDGDLTFAAVSSKLQVGRERWRTIFYNHRHGNRPREPGRWWVMVVVGGFWGDEEGW